MARAACVGDNCIDRYLHPVNRTYVGGNAVNVAVAMARLGIESAYVGAVGDDADGQRVLDTLKAEGIDISHLRVAKGKTAYTDIALQDGDRVIVQEQMGVMETFRLDQALLDFVSGYDLAHNTLLGQTWRHLRALKKRHVIVSFDFSDRANEAFLDKTLPYVDIAFHSLPEASLEVAKAFAQRVFAAGPQLVVITMGANGSMAFDGAYPFTQDAIPVDPLVDTLGAGDAFIGTFLASWLKGEPISVCLSQGTLLASQACTHLGAWIPARESEGEAKP